MEKMRKEKLDIQELKNRRQQELPHLRMGYIVKKPTNAPLASECCEKFCAYERAPIDP